MTQQEFENRTKAFLVPEVISQYHDCFEPAYLNADGVDKDTFCAALKYPGVREIVTELSKTISRLECDIKASKARYDERIYQLNKEVESARACAECAKAGISLISSNCDRALSQLAQLSFAAGVAATR